MPTVLFSVNALPVLTERALVRTTGCKEQPDKSRDIVRLFVYRMTVRYVTSVSDVILASFSWFKWGGRKIVVKTGSPSDT